MEETHWAMHSMVCQAVEQNDTLLVMDYVDRLEEVAKYLADNGNRGMFPIMMDEGETVGTWVTPEEVAACREELAAWAGRL